MHLLYVEDNKNDAQLIQTILQHFAPETSLKITPSIIQAKSILSDELSHFDLILIDLNLQDGNGIQLLQWIREKNINIAAVILTGTDDQEVALTALKAGANDYLLKCEAVKFNDQESCLVPLLESALRHHQNHQFFLNRPVKVLYTEHHRMDIDLTIRYLAKHAPNIHVSVAYNAEQTLSLLPEQASESCDFDLLLLDYRLPTTDALELTKKIRQQRKLNIPIILVSGQGNVELAIQAQNLGINEYLVKQENYLMQLPLAIEKVYNQSILQKQQDTLNLAHVVFQNAHEALVITDTNGLIENVNPSFTAMTGYTKEEVLGQSPNILKSDKHDDEFYFQLWQQLEEQGYWQGEIWNKHKDGTAYPQFLSINTSYENDRKPKHYVGVMTDISDIKASEANLQHLAHFDHLTDLPNRLSLQQHLEQAIKTAKRNQEKLAVVFIDLDRFKNINDSLGHSIGDKLLVDLAARLLNSIGTQGKLYRMGGDEFVFLIENLSDHVLASDAAQTILRTLDNPFVLTEEHEVFVDASIGICIYPNDGDSPESLIQNADVAMYQAKHKGRNTFCFYTADLGDKVRQRLEMDARLRRALINQEFILHYQPQVDNKTGLIQGCEALLRWQPPEQTLVSPMEFIPVAEETGLIVPIGKWVLLEACQQAKKWLDDGLHFGTISVNLSARQFFNDDVVKTVSDILKQSQLPSNKLRLELTESMIMEGGPKAETLLTQLKQLGVSLSLDDFGTGYSSLAYLKRFPIDELKIDKSFVGELSENALDKGIVAIIIDIAKTFNLGVIAEGVETKEQLNYLLSQECFYSQGYYFSRPLPLTEIRQLLESKQTLFPDET
ncbi:MAG: EAL domain-containing protein [Oleiphilus sp.]